MVLNAPAGGKRLDHRDAPPAGVIRLASPRYHRGTVGHGKPHPALVRLHPQLHTATAMADRIADQLAEDQRRVSQPGRVVKTPPVQHRRYRPARVTGRVDTKWQVQICAQLAHRSTVLRRTGWRGWPD